MARRSIDRVVPSLSAALLLLGGAAEAGLNPEFTLHRPSTAMFFMDYDSGDGVPNRVIHYGIPGDVGLLADVDGDTLADVIVYRGGGWLIDLRNDGSVDMNLALGGPSDIPVAADFLGKGKAGIGVYRPSTGTWFLDRDLDGSAEHVSTYGGAGGDLPVVADYNGDGLADRAIYNSGVWSIDFGFNGTTDTVSYLGTATDWPFAGDFDGDWKADNAVYRDGVWFLDYGNNSTVDRTFNYGGADDRPLFGPVNPATSLFVRAGAGGGNGSQALPYGTVNQALAAATTGTIIRIAAGNYPENVLVFRESGLTFLGAGVKATHLQGGSATAPPSSPTDAVTVFESPNIVFRNLHVKSPDARGIVNQGSGLTLDRITTIKNWSHGVLGVGTTVTASLVVESSNINKSRMGNGLRLEGGVVATVRRSTINGSGRLLTEPRPTASGNGRGVESFNDSQLTLEYSTVNNSYDGGLLLVQNTNAVIRYSTVNANGTNGVFLSGSVSAQIYGNNMDNNGTAGTRGPASGYNAIEVFNGWNGPLLQIYDNWLQRSTTNGIYVGGSAVNVLVSGNTFYNNFLGLTIVNATAVTLQSNLFELPLAQAAEEGILIVGPGPNVSVGGPGAANTFRNFIGADSPAIHCAGVVVVSCPSGGNTFDNVTVPVQGCPATCTP
jgi:parallel beta-helix repeat protein